ncbi:MAG: helix-turn-helix domain-containing protein [Sphingopyxis sp.]|uniref:TetR/AcrR family transcriptional regulator n=1 Tax=Sphingopyxis sp. TaxID=1908224 RepID=UPI002ABAB271|nr:helix-turn-helix domain-containing protein [Sphingopyxis sp.]MDZ3832914.1 helix-turn-helix domain-containing protein [Sphingopyxis sp.]
MPAKSETRRRLSRDDRFRQLVETAWRMLGQEGADALSLGRLAERAGVTKPLVYDHFGTREGLLAALFRDFDRRQAETMNAALAASADTLEAKAEVLADAYVECVARQGREIPGILAALAGSPEMNAIIREHERVFTAKCRRLFAPFAGDREPGAAALWAMLGSADALSRAAAAGDLSADEARAELYRTIVQMVRRTWAADDS